MPNATITIPQPILVSGQYFKTRYRLLPSGSWSGYTNRTNAPFTITGLSAAQYQLEVILVKADGTNCPPVYKIFTLIGDYTCINFQSRIIKSGTLYYIEITYTPPSGNPPCGWEIMYTQSSVTKTVTYTSLPASGKIMIPVPNIAASLYVRADLCGGRKKDCHGADLLAVVESPCIPLHVTNQQLTKLGQNFFITITFTQSNPITTVLKVSYLQVGAVIGAPDPGKTLLIPIGGATTIVTFQVYPNINSLDEKAHYDGVIADGCNTTTRLQVERLVF